MPKIWIEYWIYLILTNKNHGDYMDKEYNAGSLLILKKGHPCGENLWEVVKLGADIRLKCTKCGRLVIIPRIELNKRIKKVKEKVE